MEQFVFSTPLIEGVIHSRRSQFTIIVKVNDELCTCHCPTTGRIGNIDLADRPCLLSASKDFNRKTPFTVEAISLDSIRETEKKWIGINQNAANRYVEHYLRNGGFADMIGDYVDIQREQFLGKSKLDFLVDDIYLEVKTPLQHLQVDIPKCVKTKKVTPFSSTDRFVKHITTLAASLQSHQRAILLSCFIYDNPGFRVIEKSTNFADVKKAMEECTTAGVEQWQANFKITPNAVSLKKYFKINI